MFKLQITLGNDAMRSAQDVANALSKVSSKLFYSTAAEDSGIIRDDNGNKVWTWEIEGASSGEDDGPDMEEDPRDEDY